MPFRHLRTDRQFEQALINQRTVCVRGKWSRSCEYIGRLEGFNPVVVTVGDNKFFRDDCDFLCLR